MNAEAPRTRPVKSGCHVSKCWVIVLALAIACCLSTKSYGDVVASDYTGGGTLSNFGNATGWSFIPNEDLVVTGLGVYDYDSDGFAETHNVGIFLASDFSAVVTSFLPGGPSGIFVPGTVDGTRMVSVAPVTLLAGVEYYTLADNFGIDQYAFGPAAVTYASQLSWTGFVDGTTNDIFSDPLFLGGAPGTLGPNFQFRSIPEPSGVALMGVVLVSLFARRRRSCRGP